MSHTLDREETITTTTRQIIEDAKAEFLRARDRMLKDLATTPGDRLRWSPSPTARSPLMLVVHTANSIEGVLGMFRGEEFDFESLPKLDPQWRQAEAKFTSRDEAADLLRKNSAEYIAWMESLSPEEIRGTRQMPFGEFPMAAVITWMADHVRNHCAQMEYVQTAYGDLDWHY